MFPLIPVNAQANTATSRIDRIRSVGNQSLVLLGNIQWCLDEKFVEKQTLCGTSHIGQRKVSLTVHRRSACRLDVFAERHVLGKKWRAERVEEIGRYVGFDRLLGPRCCK